MYHSDRKNGGDDHESKLRYMKLRPQSSDLMRYHERCAMIGGLSCGNELLIVFLERSRWLEPFCENILKRWATLLLFWHQKALAGRQRHLG